MFTKLDARYHVVMKELGATKRAPFFPGCPIPVLRQLPPDVRPFSLEHAQRYATHAVFRG